VQLAGRLRFVRPAATDRDDPRPAGLDPKGSYWIVLELFRGERDRDGANRLAVYETRVFRA
jgi:hypothetical protein